MNNGRNKHNDIHHDDENISVVTPFDEGNETIQTTTTRGGVHRVVQVRTYSGVWSWLRDNCYVPFIASFQQQLFNDVVHAGINIFPIIPIGYFFSKSRQRIKPCQEMTQVEMEQKASEVQNRNQNRGWKDKVFSVQGVFILSLLAAICLVGITDDSHRQPPSHTTRSAYHHHQNYRTYKHDSTSDTQNRFYPSTNRGATAFQSPNNKTSNTNPLDKARQDNKNNVMKER
ncbi:hypothetical protein RFI_06507 [Reticulomyxa filosa]|uniref:Transmembrane protein n=1 Tax=Reticulomyxa filosa TaxID=46433 RepID=X6NXR2_RETFI|nr:hypothetical protein RFI_06507 [Reticulomyxa filosa]|eukprot:ETO30614.1 hypothetical protein RFI_06507 [Reticulomyxa filosa]